MRKGRDGEKKNGMVENTDENSGPLTSLPVDRLTATDCNAAKMYIKLKCEAKFKLMRNSNSI